MFALFYMLLFSQRPLDSDVLVFDELTNMSLDWNLSLECGVELSSEDWVQIDHYRWRVKET